MSPPGRRPEEEASRAGTAVDRKRPRNELPGRVRPKRGGESGKDLASGPRGCGRPGALEEGFPSLVRKSAPPLDELPNRAPTAPGRRRLSHRPDRLRRQGDRETPGGLCPPRALDPERLAGF